MSLERQIEIETKALNFSFDKFINDISKRIQGNAAHELPEGAILLKTCIDLVSKKLDEFFSAPLRGNNKKARLYIEDYQFRTKDLAYLITSVVISSLSSKTNVSVITLSRDIAQAIYNDYAVRDLKGNSPNLDAYMTRKYKRRGEGFIKRSKIRLAKYKLKLNDTQVSSDIAILGSMMLDIINKSGCNLIHIYSSIDNRRNTYLVSFTKEAFKLILQAREYHMGLYLKYPILIMPPTDWTGLKGSLGYYSKNYKGLSIKTRTSNIRTLQQFLEVKPMTRALSILNTIGKTAWRINKRVYSVLDEVLKNNLVDYSSPKQAPYLLGSLPFNRHMEATDYVKGSDYGECYTEGWKINTPIDKEAYKKYKQALDIQEGIIQINLSKAIALNLAMIDARDYLNEPNIYFSYQFDFRGRIYPIQQHLNPQGKEEIKALLEFSNGYPIETDEELYWFMIHGANCYGFDKLEYDERIVEIEKKKEEICLIAQDPIRYSSFWKDVDSPYLYLAWCFEYNDYINNPNTFRSHIPIALDGTCSGLQIYGGLLLDEVGAKEVNVVNKYNEDNKAIRADIYGSVANKVNEYLLKHEYNKFIDITKADGTTETVSTIATASSMAGKITRSLTKRNVMTQPYSVTRYGMYNQLLDEMEDMENSNKKFWIGDRWLASKVLVDLNDRAITEIVKGARVGQEFLKSITRDVTSEGRYIFYTTPLIKFPVLQRINKHKDKRVNTELGRLVIRQFTDEIHHIKMASGIAPNYIHSLDATLLMLTVEKMREVCSDFHLIHDSYGVPVKHIPLLNKCIRESYIEIFKSNPLHRFVRQVLPDRIGEVDSVMLNTLNLDDVRDAAYIFS